MVGGSAEHAFKGLPFGGISSQGRALIGSENNDPKDVTAARGLRACIGKNCCPRRSPNRNTGTTQKLILMSFLFGAILLVGTVAVAQPAQEEAKSPAAQEAQKHLYNYGELDRACIRWGDQCRTCSRSSSEGEPSCSNIGIACQPKQVECLERKQTGETK